MILFAILVLVNFTASTDLLFEYRMDVAGLPLNLLDAFMVVIVIRQLVRSRSNDFQADSLHPLFVWSIVLLTGGALLGVLGSTMNGTSTRDWITALRNLTMLPLAIFVGYMTARTPRSARTITKIWLTGAILSGIAVLFLVRDTAEEVKWGKTFDALRHIRHGGDAGLTALAFLAFGVVARIRLLPRLLTIPVLLLSAAAAFSLPHRGTYVVGLCTLVFTIVALPRVPLKRRLGSMVVGIVLLGVSLLAMSAVISQVTGRDFKSYVIEKRVKQLLPAYDEETKTTVLATRLPGILAELQLWLESPLIGQGFAIGTAYEDQMGARGMGMNHNVWTSALSQMGPVGFLGYVVPVIGCTIVGFRLWRDQTEPNIALLGALGAITGVISFLWASISMTINQQRLAIVVGLMFGIIFRCRAMQLTLVRQQAEAGYADDPAGYEPMAYDRAETVPTA